MWGGEGGGRYLQVLRASGSAGRRQRQRRSEAEPSAERRALNVKSHRPRAH